MIIVQEHDRSKTVPSPGKYIYALSLPIECHERGLRKFIISSWVGSTGAMTDIDLLSFAIESGM